jgi:hypothetical protein
MGLKGKITGFVKMLRFYIIGPCLLGFSKIAKKKCDESIPILSHTFPNAYNVRSLNHSKDYFSDEKLTNINLNLS